MQIAVFKLKKYRVTYLLSNWHVSYDIAFMFAKI